MLVLVCQAAREGHQKLGAAKVMALSHQMQSNGSGCRPQIKLYDLPIPCAVCLQLRRRPCYDDVKTLSGKDLKKIDEP
jgi:hypothetical protein